VTEIANVLCREVWPGVELFLCLWHVQHAWMKQACAKVRDMFTRVLVLRSVGQLMYLSNTPDERCPPVGPQDVPRNWTILDWAKESYNSLKRSIPVATTFWKYFNKEWIPKAKMWLTRVRNIPHAGQDTTVAIESYHGNMKVVLRQSKGKLVGKRVDWLIHQLTGDVINRYDYMQFKKENGFVTNKRGRSLMLSALTQAQKIPDSNVRLPASEGKPAFVWSSKRSYLEYAVYNPCTEWTMCECVHSQKGNICKHQLKVLRMTRPDIAEDNIARYLGSLRGTAAGGFKNLIADANGEIPFDAVGPGVSEGCIRSPPRTPLRPILGERYEDDDNHMHQLIVKVIERAYRYPIVKRHLICSLVKVDTIHRGIEVQIQNQILHPTEPEAAPFELVNDNSGAQLKCIHDFLEVRGWRTRDVRPCINNPTYACNLFLAGFQGLSGR
jgi:hypothetical protein